MKLSKILDGVKKESVKGSTETEISGIAYDSRSVLKGSLFVAVTGFKENGTEYVDDAVSRGARAVVYEHDIKKGFGREIASVKVADAREALSRVSANFYGEPSKEIGVAGVTGTNGKTTVTYLVESILKASGKITAVVGTINHRIAGRSREARRTTPEATDLHSFLREAVDCGVRHAVMEVSSHAIVLKRVEDIHFDICLFTNLSSDHMDFHGNREEYLKAKAALFTRVLEKSAKRDKYAVFNWEDPSSKEISRLTHARKLRYGLSDSLDIGIVRMDLSTDRTRATLKIFDKTVDIESDLVGRFNLSNILAASAIAHLGGISIEDIGTGIRDLKYVPGRIERVKNDRGINIYVDYAHTEDALKNVLKMINDIRTGRIITVFGCGGDRDREKRPKMGNVVTSMSDLSIVTSDNPRSEEPMDIIEEIVGGIDKRTVIKVDGKDTLREGKRYFRVIEDRKEAIETAIRSAREGDTVLIAGKGHEDYQETMGKREYFNDRDCVISIVGK